MNNVDVEVVNFSDDRDSLVTSVSSQPGNGVQQLPASSIIPLLTICANSIILTKLPKVACELIIELKSVHKFNEDVPVVY